MVPKKLRSINRSSFKLVLESFNFWYFFCVLWWVSRVGFLKNYHTPLITLQKVGRGGNKSFIYFPNKIQVLKILTKIYIFNGILNILTEILNYFTFLTENFQNNFFYCSIHSCTIFPPDAHPQFFFLHFFPAHIHFLCVLTLGIFEWRK
jgi:hypothetical protein